MNAVIDINHYRRPEGTPPPGNPIKITFFGQPFRDENDRPIKLICSFIVEDGRIDPVIDGVRDLGGVWLPGESASQAWFLAWPPAAISISPP